MHISKHNCTQTALIFTTSDLNISKMFNFVL